MKQTRFLVLCLLIILIQYSCKHKAKEEIKKPNILVLMSDNQYYKHLGCYGDNVVKTPNIDRIAIEGVRFINAYCASPSCTPARGAMLTGQEIWRLGEGANLWSTLSDSLITYQDVLEENGYLTGHDRKGWGPGNNNAGGRDKNPAGTTYKDFREFLNKNTENKPWSYFFSSTNPHRPFKYNVTENTVLNIDSVKVPSYLPDSRKVRLDICDYYSEIMNFDKQVKEAMDFLKEKGMSENTMVVVCADNGWMMPRGLANLYDFGTKVPLIISWQGKIMGNRVVTDFVSLNDLAPTFLEFAGLPVPENMTARSLKNILMSEQQGRIEEERSRVFVARERHALCRRNGLGYPGRAIRTDNFLYIHNYKPDRWPAGDPPLFGDIDAHMLQYESPTKEYMMIHKDDPEVKKLYKQAFLKRPEEELFDLKNDPYQMNNVAYLKEYQNIKARLATQLRKYLIKTNDPRETGGEIIWDNQKYYKETDWVGKPRKEAREKFGLKEKYPYK